MMTDSFGSDFMRTTASLLALSTGLRFLGGSDGWSWTFPESGADSYA